ncbi:hypothetical protein BGZ94_003256 [Podila epigama]|nr:hypothetical protein BGZ94_003256 [Podila epigama]
MHFNLSLLTVAAIVAPALAAKTWDVNVVNGMFSPQELDIAPGDTVRWPMNDGADHAIVETTSGARTCNNKAGGFNSGRKTKGQAYQRTFRTVGHVNYKDGIGANCVRGATGTIFVHNGQRQGGGPSKTAAPISSPTSRPNGAMGLSAEKSVLLGVACFIGALAL